MKMSDTSNFESLLKQNSNKKQNILYTGCKQQNKDNVHLIEVLSGVYSQIKILQASDSKHVKSFNRNNLKSSSSKFLSVNNMPVYRELPSTSTKFDTLCVSDTQLIDLIENAEMEQNNDISQEFDTSFHNIELHKDVDKHVTELKISLKSSNTQTKDIERDMNTPVSVIERDKNISTGNSGTIPKTAVEKLNTMSMKQEEKHTETFNSVTEVEAKEKDSNSLKSRLESNKNFNSIKTLEQYSENLFDDTIVVPEIHNIESIEKIDTTISNDNNIENEIDDIERDNYSPILNQCKEDEIFIERPISPIFLHRNTKSKSNTPSPRVFNLETFEQFENIVIPLLENNDFNTAKTIINSQIMDGELLINMHEKVKLNFNEGTNNSVVQKEDRIKMLLIDSSNIDKVIEVKENLNKVINNEDAKVNVTPKDLLEDEILFSSDEESNIDTNYKDLPFTCALDTCFDQSDLLDKTVYTGFQTASNTSILVGKESFDKAKSFLDVESISITEMVNNCDNFRRDNNQDIKDKTGNEFNDDDDFENKTTKEDSHILDNISKVIIPGLALPEIKTTSFQGFVTANNKKITLSEKALARCKKVFQDINLTENLEIEPVDEDKYEEIFDKADENPINIKGNYEKCNVIDMAKLQNTKDDETTTKTGHVAISDTQIVLDDAMIKQLNDIEMSLQDKQKIPAKHHNDESIVTEINSEAEIVLKDVNKPDVKENYDAKETKFEGFKTASNTIIKISKEAIEKTKNLFQDIDNGNDINKFNEDIINIETIQLTASQKFGGFKTASNKNINISNIALSKVRNIFKDIDTEELALKNEELGELYPNNQETELIGFKTASKNKINVSNQTLLHTKNIFQDIELVSKEIEDKEDLDKINKNNMKKNPYPDIKRSVSNENLTIHEDKANTTAQDIKPLKYTEKSKKSEADSESLIKSAFLGFQTANNKQIGVSFEALEKTKYIFKDFDSPKRENTKDVTVNPQPSTSKAFPGFFTANNKPISVSEESLTQTKMLFNNIDLVNTENMIDKKCVNPNVEPNEVMKENKPFLGFKTANNTTIVISKEALAKTKDIFKDIDSDIQIPKTGSLKAIENINKDTAADSSTLPSSKTSFGGFKTANNNKIKISDAALAKTKAMFEEIDCTDLFIPINKKKDYPDIEDKKGGDTGTPSISAVGTRSIPFQGFQTASNKNVKVSAEALAKTKNIFRDIDKLEESTLTENVNEINIQTSFDDGIETTDKDFIKTSPVFKGFATANNKKVNISEECLAKAKKMLQDFDEDTVSPTNKDSQTNITPDIYKTKRLFSQIDEQKPDSINKKCKNEPLKDAIENIIDTQVLNDFEESLHTEDFKETPKPLKRSSSPILSCPRAKKRKKFEIPYSQTKIIQPIIETEEAIKTNDIFDENYKKDKKYTLRDLQRMTVGLNTETDSYIENFNFDNLLNFEFTGDRNIVNSSIITVNDIKEIFLNNVNKKLVPDGWIENHLRLILWKLISYERFFKNLIRCDTKTVLDQLKYRYNVELYHAKRPALRKILEKDDIPSKTMVLCVAGVYMDDFIVTRPTNPTNIELLLTDGWYSIRTVIDRMLAELVCNGRIFVGTKLVTSGAELLNCQEGVSPWEDTSAVRLKIFGNSTRRARWDTRLGYHGNAAILSHLSAVKLSGGKVSKLRVFVTRVYPALYVDKFEDGSTVTRSERLELLHQATLETERQVMMEKIYEEVEKEFDEMDSQDSDGASNSGPKRICLDSGSQISKFIKKSRDPGEAKAHLTSSQSKLLEDFTSIKHNQLLEDIQKRVREKIGEVRQRNVVMLVKIRVADVENNGVDIVKGMLSIWKPTDAVLELIKEGAWIDIINVTPTALRYSEIQLSAGRQTIFNTSKYKTAEKVKPYIDLLKRKCYTIKDLALNPLMSTDYNEIDTAGIIFLIDPSMPQFDPKKQQFQNVFLADADKNIISINFWGGLAKFGYENVLDTGQVIFCGNLQKRVGNTRKNIPQYRATELSYFTKTPKNHEARDLVEDFNKKFSSLDRKKFCEDCVVIKNNYFNIKQIENISPYRFNTSDVNCSKNRVFIDSPLTKTKIDDNLNLTGLDFESTFKQTDTQYSEEIIQRKKKVNEKIAKLKMYGEPPPLSPLNIINKSKNASSSYKSPLLDKNSPNINVNTIQNTLQSKSDSSINIANVKNTPQNSGNPEKIQCDSVLNRTYVKGMNPVKINFDVQDNNDSSVNHFAEDFDGSPPLSLD